MGVLNGRSRGKSSHGTGRIWVVSIPFKTRCLSVQKYPLHSSRWSLPIPLLCDFLDSPWVDVKYETLWKQSGISILKSSVTFILFITVEPRKYTFLLGLVSKRKFITTFLVLENPFTQFLVTESLYKMTVQP